MRTNKWLDITACQPLKYEIGTFWQSMKDVGMLLNSSCPSKKQQALTIAQSSGVLSTKSAYVDHVPNTIYLCTLAINSLVAFRISHIDNTMVDKLTSC